MKVLRIYMEEKNRIGDMPLYERVARSVYEFKLKGMTVFKGIESFGPQHRIHKGNFFSLSGDLPIVIEIVDEEEKLREFVGTLKKIPFDIFVTLGDVEIV